MVFSDPLFIFLFLPAFLIVYFSVKDQFLNLVITIGSIVFYYIGEQKYFWVLFAVIIVNFSFGALILNQKGRVFPGLKLPIPSILLSIGIIIDLGMLIYFKYIGFFTSNVKFLLESTGINSGMRVVEQALPLGVSFFVFQGISYLIDVYRGDVNPTRSLLKFTTYKTLFPQLIAGPIVRYADVAKEMDGRTSEASQIFEGVRRFCVGFVKKVLFADTFAVCADAIFGLPPGNLSASAAWLGAVCYALQIYFDFSAYSDMAIGLGLMMGFRYPENFSHPYISRSVREFWRRWHMTLSAWFRDYVYRPLGGNRRGATRTYVNLMIVFMLTGFWHGASWTFVAWGLWHGLFMLIERRFDPDKWPVPRVVSHVYLLLVVLFGWVLFRADSFHNAFGMLGRMMGVGATEVTRYSQEFLNPLLLGTLVIGLVLCMPIHDWVRQRLNVFWAFPLGTVALGSVVAPKSPDISHGAAWAAMNSRGERYPSDLCG